MNNKRNILISRHLESAARLMSGLLELFREIMGRHFFVNCFSINDDREVVRCYVRSRRDMK